MLRGAEKCCTGSVFLPYHRLTIARVKLGGSGVVLAFGEHRLDIARRELRRGAELVSLPPKAFDLLVFLVQHRDRVVGKDDLLREVWGGRIVSESAITTRINAVRRALADDGTAQRLVRTFVGRGIRFVGEVRDLSEAEVLTINVPNEQSPDQAPQLPAKPSLAVLPFQNMSGDPDQEYFADGVVEEITIAIARFPWLLVIARNSAFAYKGRAVDVRQVARELGVRYVLEGSVRKAGNRVRITGQLIDTATLGHIWAGRFDGALDNIFELQDQVTVGVVCAIEPKLRLAEIDRALRKPTESLDAYDFYLRAQAQAFKRTKEGMAEAVCLARKALELDPGYGPAMARLAQSLAMQGVRGWIPLSGPEAEEGVRMARQAIAAAGDDQWTLTYAGMAIAILIRDYDAALAAIDRAIELNPNFALAIAFRALFLSYQHDRADEAIRWAERALSLNPLDPSMFSAWMAMAFAYLAAGRYEAGLPWAERARREAGGLPSLCLKLSLCGHLGRQQEAGECLRELRAVFPAATIARLNELQPGLTAELKARFAEGWRKVGLPEK